jgi:hypothetical protein
MVEPAVLLEAWERASSCAPLVRPLVVLAALDTATDVEALAAEPLGRRDARLARLLYELDGPHVEATAACPACAEAVEVQVDVRVLWAVDQAPPGPVVVDLAGRPVRCRPVTTADLQAVAGNPDARIAVLERCLSGPDGEPVEIDVDIDALADAVDAAFEEADPGADVVLGLACPACATAWEAPFDIAEFVWVELERRAREAVAEVDLLARAYGWRESDILGLSGWRRRRYLELVRG